MINASYTNVFTEIRPSATDLPPPKRAVANAGGERIASRAEIGFGVSQTITMPPGPWIRRVRGEQAGKLFAHADLRVKSVCVCRNMQTLGVG